MGMIALAVVTAPSFFGITMHDPVPVPRCQSEYSWGMEGATDCWWSYHYETLPSDGNVDLKRTAADPLPGFGMIGDPMITVMEGKVSGLYIHTSGLPWQEKAYQVLLQKLGAPKSLHRISMHNAMGATFVKITAEWRYGDVNVSFTGFDDYDIGKGVIDISTDANNARLVADYVATHNKGSAF